MTIFTVDIGACNGGPAELDRGPHGAVRVVNAVARCGLPAQYTGPHPRCAPATAARVGGLTAAVQRPLPH